MQRLGAAHGANEIDVQHMLKELCVHFFAAFCDGGAIDQNIHFIPAFGKAVYGVRVGHIQLRIAEARRIFGQAFGFGAGDFHVTTRILKRARNRGPDAATAGADPGGGRDDYIGRR